jgi:HPt (histidine-containing phosphotransfer) domain-containing protein
MTRPGALDPEVLDRLRQLSAPGEPDVLAEVLSLFTADVPGRLARLRDALQAADAPAIQRLAHSVKGSAGNIGARALFDISRQLDDAGKAGDLQGAAALVALLEAEYQRVATEIQSMLG